MSLLRDSSAISGRGVEKQASNKAWRERNTLKKPEEGIDYRYAGEERNVELRGELCAIRYVMTSSFRIP